jgi:hypothetical protein
LGDVDQFGLRLRRYQWISHALTPSEVVDRASSILRSGEDRL